MSILVQTYLLTHSFAQLAAEHAVYPSFSKDRTKVSLNYDQIESKESNPIACECRGLILALPRGEPFPEGEYAVGKTLVLARPFARFFNHGQHGTDASKLLGQSGTRVYEKLDGTLCIVYYDIFKKEWHVATRSVPEADRAINGFGNFTFRTLFEHALQDHLNLSFERFTSILHEEFTYLFELTAPHNRVVVEYNQPRIHLLSVRQTCDERGQGIGAELCLVKARHLLFKDTSLSIPHAPYKEVNTLGELISIVTQRNPREYEGLVVCGPKFERVKVKNPAYVALSALKSSVANSPRRLLEVILLGKEDDVFPMIAPDIAEIGRDYKERFVQLVKESDRNYEEFFEKTKNMDNPRKYFAIEVQKSKGWMAYYMNRYTGRCGHFMGFVRAEQDNTGSWRDSFLDSLLGALKNLTLPGAQTLSEVATTSP